MTPTKPMIDADRASGTLYLYGCAAGQPNEDLQTQATDLLADLMHLCDRDGFSFTGLVDSARVHADAERSEADGYACQDCGEADPARCECDRRVQAREVIAYAERFGFVREPSMPSAYEEYLLDDADEAAEWIADRGTA